MKLYLYPVYQTMEPTMQNSEINVTFVSSQTTTKTQEEEGKTEGKGASLATGPSKKCVGTPFLKTLCVGTFS